MEDKIEPT